MLLPPVLVASIRDWLWGQRRRARSRHTPVPPRARGQRPPHEASAQPLDNGAWNRYSNSWGAPPELRRHPLTMNQERAPTDQPKGPPAAGEQPPAPEALPDPRFLLPPGVKVRLYYDDSPDSREAVRIVKEVGIPCEFIYASGHDLPAMRLGTLSLGMLAGVVYLLKALAPEEFKKVKLRRPLLFGPVG